MEDINVFVFSKLKLMNEKPSKVISWITILCFLVIIFLIINIFFKYNVYSNYIGYIKDNNIRIIMDDNSFPIKKDYKLYIGKKKYDYKVLNIEKKEEYYELLINCKLDKKLLIDNNILMVRFKIKKTTLFRIIVDKIKKGLI